jgi:ribosomal protein L2
MFYTTLLVKNNFPLTSMLEGVVVWNVEHYMGDYGMFTKVSMDYTIVVSHNLDTYITQYPSQSPFFRLKNLKYKDIITIVGPYVWILISS